MTQMTQISPARTDDVISPLKAQRTQVLSVSSVSSVDKPDLSCLHQKPPPGGFVAYGDDRVRTDDPLLAKQVLSQLSYAPKKWWAREDLNLRPHAYQACALTS